MESLTFDQIKINCLDEWVLIANPLLDDPYGTGSVVSKLISGVLLSSSKDKRELAYKAKEFRPLYTKFCLVFTGQYPENKKWLL
jgi:hypothetical protein